MAIAGLDGTDDVPDIVINTGNWIIDNTINTFLNGFNFFVEVIYDAVLKPALRGFMDTWNASISWLTGLGVWSPIAMAIVGTLYIGIIMIGIKIILTIKNIIM